MGGPYTITSAIGDPLWSPRIRVQRHSVLCRRPNARVAGKQYKYILYYSILLVWYTI